MGKDFYRNLSETARIAAEAARIIDSVTQTAHTVLESNATWAMAERAAMIEQVLQRAERRYATAIKALGGDPRAAHWDDWTLTDLEDAAAVAKRLRARYGAQLTVTHGAPDAPRRGPREKVTKQVFETMTRLLRDGLTYDQVGARLGISAKTIQRALRKPQP